MGELYVQYGCGQSAPQTWINFDCSLSLRLQRLPLLGRIHRRGEWRFPAHVRFGDIVKGLPLPEGSCKAMYCSHVLEHLSLEDCQTALANTHRYLQEGGVFRLVLPDLAALAADYLSSDSATAAHEFMERAHLGRVRRARTLVGFVVEWLGSSNHLWMWDERSMRGAVQAHGFVAIRRCQYGDAADPMFAQVEERSRFEGCLAMECRK